MPKYMPWYVLTAYSKQFTKTIRALRKEFGHRNVFVPRCFDIVNRGGKLRKTGRAYALRDLVFVHANLNELEEFRSATAATTCVSPFAYCRDRCTNPQCPQKMTVNWLEMKRFRESYQAVDRHPQVHAFAELNTPDGLQIDTTCKVRLVSPCLNGVTGYYAWHKNTTKKVFAITLANLLVLQIDMQDGDLFEIVED